MTDWGTELHNQHKEWESTNRPYSMPSKRPASGGDDLTVRAKKPKTIGGDEGIDDAEMKKLFAKHEVQKVRLYFNFEHAVLRLFIWVIC